MKYEEFKVWLTRVYEVSPGRKMDARAIASRLANCRRVDEYEGELDQYAATVDRQDELLRRLTYSTDDAQHARTPLHCIPLDGDTREGTATLKAAVKLYFKFAGNPGSFSGLPAPGSELLNHLSPRKNAASPSAWPIWEQPSESEMLTLARMISRHVRFLAPAIIEAIVNDNERQQENWKLAFKELGIDANAYYWKLSSCAFPGVRRYAGSHEIAVFRKKAKTDGGTIQDALSLDDNEYPKQIWSFVFLGKKFPKHGPVGYALAHLADHKRHNNRFESDFDLVGDSRSALFGLYTCPTNSAYVPSSMIKPTDFGPKLRNLLMRRAEQLYGAHCSLLPEWLKIRDESSAEWHLDAFDWAEPVGEAKGIEDFLKYRNGEIDRLIAALRGTGTTA